jgi:signal transduction histidine kinase
LEHFTELVATSIANAESRLAVRALAAEQAALRRVATLAARGVPIDEIFSAVGDEAHRLLGSNTAAVVKVEHDPLAFVVVGIGRGVTGIPLGTRSPLTDGLAVTEAYRTGRSARIEAQDWAVVHGTIGEAARHLRIASAVATPIMAGDRVWGMISVSATEPLPSGTEERLERFGELLGIAIASADAQRAIRVLAAEQEALRRVATLVARGVPSGEIFSAVSAEVARLFGVHQAAVIKFDNDAAVGTFVAITRRIEEVEIGTRLRLSDETALGQVYATGRPARVDRSDWSTAVSQIGRIAARHGYVSSVSSPIVVDGRLWGAASALSTREPLPAEAEERMVRFSALVATAIANADSRSELAASRRRIVAASDGARRRIERDLHDGTQRRLESLARAMRTVEASVPPALADIRSDLSRIATGLDEALADVQEITHGIHPANLEQLGLVEALRTLARRSPTPVELETDLAERVPEPVEVAAYYVVSEALANAAKHAQATGIAVSLAHRDDQVIVSIRDDGIGGADPGRGSGLVGLADRVEALGGQLEVRSPTGSGTHVTATLPLDPEIAAVLA